MRYILLFIIAICGFSCATKQITKDDSYYYQEGMKMTQKKLYQDAASSFAEVGRGKFFIKAKIMEAYAYYKSKLYNDAIAKIEIVKNLASKTTKQQKLYLNYLEGMSYYRQLAHYKASQGNAKLAFDNFQNIIDDPQGKKWHGDSKKRLKIIKDRISKNYIYLGRYYMETEKFIPAINAFNIAANNVYSQTRRAEALYRLAEIYYHLGVDRKTKQLLNIIDAEYSTDNKWRKYSKKLRMSL